MSDVDDIDRIFRILDRILNSSFSGGIRLPESHYQNVDVIEDEDSIYITIDLGNADGNLDIIPLRSGILLEGNINGEEKRQILDVGIDLDKDTLESSLNNGILDIRIKKLKKDTNDQI